jgi:hypothetical protein
MFADDEVGFEDLKDFHANSKFTVAAYTSGTSAHPYYAATLQPDNSADADSSCGLNIRYDTLRLNKNSIIGQAWSNSTKLLSYDAQCKISWGYQLSYGAGGISFRLHQNGTSYNTLGVSFMKYRAIICNLPWWQQQSYNDYIPDSIKPSSSLAGRCLVVLWQQQGSHRTWLAYKDLSNDQCIGGNQWDRDGQCVTDNSLIMVRVVEKMISGAKKSDISVYYGDASNPRIRGGCGGGTYPCNVNRTGDAVAYNYPTSSTGRAATAANPITRPTSTAPAPRPTPPGRPSP